MNENTIFVFKKIAHILLVTKKACMFFGTVAVQKLLVYIWSYCNTFYVLLECLKMENI